MTFTQSTHTHTHCRGEPIKAVKKRRKTIKMLRVCVCVCVCVWAGYEVVSDTCAALYPTLIPLWSHTHTLKWDSRLISFFNSHLIYRRGPEYICKHTHKLAVIIAPRTHTLHMNTQPYATIIMCQADKHTHRNDSRLYSGVCLPRFPACRVPHDWRESLLAFLWYGCSTNSNYF